MGHVALSPVSPPRSSNRTCGFPASGFTTVFIAGIRRAGNMSVIHVPTHHIDAIKLARWIPGFNRCFIGFRQVTNPRPRRQTHQKSGPFAPPALPGLNATTTLSDARVIRCAARTVEAATLNHHGPPPFARYPVSACRAHYPGGPVRVHLSAASPNRTAFPILRQGRRPRLSLSRPAQASHTLRPVDSLDRPRRPLSQGFDLADYSTKPPASYRANRPLPGWDLHPQGYRTPSGRTKEHEATRSPTPA